MLSRAPGKLAAGLCAATLVVFAQGVTARKPSFDPVPLESKPIIDLSSFLAVPSCALGLNDLGTVVGSRNIFGLPYGFSWSADTGVVDLDRDTTALAVNDLGEIAGQDHVAGTGL